MMAQQTDLPATEEMMPRHSTKADELASIEARREALKAQLAELDEKAKVVEQAAKDAGRPVLAAALERVKIPAMEKTDAKAIAAAISTYGAHQVARHLNTLELTSQQT